MTKFEIGERVVDTHEPDSFYVDIEIMHGDADSFEHLEVGPFTQANEHVLMAELIDLLDRMKAAYPNGRGGGDQYNYDNVPGFAEWFLFEPEERAAEPLAWTVTNNEVSWPVDTYDYETHGTAYSYKIYYYDPQGVKFNVAGVKQND